MRRHPSLISGEARPAQPQGKQVPLSPPSLGDVIEPFLVTGGATFFIVTTVPPIFDPRPAGVQLCCSVYVPMGKVGFLKQLRVAPFMPTELVDPWTTNGAFTTGVVNWREFDADGLGPVRPGGRAGVWDTPFGWESYFDSASCGEQPPQWTWQLRLVKGDIKRQREGVAFSLVDPATWYLAPDIAVPVDGYPSGIPGNAPAGIWGSQRMQVIQGDELESHVVVPEDTTLCLFTQWTQLEFQPLAKLNDSTVVPYGPLVFPLLPSFGQLHGYMQSTRETQFPESQTSAQENARFGWGG